MVTFNEPAGQLPLGEMSHEPTARCANPALHFYADCHEWALPAGTNDDEVCDDTDDDSGHVWPLASDYCQCHRFYCADDDDFTIYDQQVN
jgi:hypothetical protein